MSPSANKWRGSKPGPWDLPVAGGEPLPVLYVQMDGTGVPGGEKKETLGRQGKVAGQPAHTREVKLGCVFTQTTWDEEGYPIRAPASTTYTGRRGKPPRSSAYAFTGKPALAVGAAPASGW